MAARGQVIGGRVRRGLVMIGGQRHRAVQTPCEHERSDKRQAAAETVHGQGGELGTEAEELMLSNP